METLEQYIEEVVKEVAEYIPVVDYRFVRSELCVVIEVSHEEFSNNLDIIFGVIDNVDLLNRFKSVQVDNIIRIYSDEVTSRLTHELLLDCMLSELGISTQ